MFNLVARFTRGCNYYLFGAAGMILLSFAQFIFVLGFLKTMMSGFSDKNEKPISFSMLLLVIMGMETTGKISFGTFILLVPFIPTMFILMAYFSKQKKYYEGAIITWGLLAALFIFFLFVIIKHGTNSDEITTNISIMFICIISSIVGCFSAASCQNEKNFENTMENPNYVSYDVDADSVVL
uniref:Uncharacterized protein n=1 Tax=Panagrolaimus sp. ES5 TaxID=591445 RepID=A0AC34FHG6_9BILA